MENDIRKEIDRVKKLEQIIKESFIDADGNLVDFSFKIQYPYTEIEPFILRFKDKYYRTMEQQAWDIIDSESDVPDEKYESDGKYGRYWQVIKSEDEDSIYPGQAENEFEAYDMARKLGLMVDKYGVVYGYKEKSFIE